MLEHRCVLSMTDDGSLQVIQAQGSVRFRTLLVESEQRVERTNPWRSLICRVKSTSYS